MLFLFLILDDFEILFEKDYSLSLPRMHITNEQLKRQGITLDIIERTKLLESACLIHQREKQILAEEKAKAETKAEAEAEAEAKKNKEIKREEEGTKQKTKPRSPRQNKKESELTNWAKKIIDGLWKYRVLLAFILTLITLLMLSALFWPAMVASAFTIVEMASAVLAVKMAALFVVAFLGACLMGYLQYLQPQLNFAKIDIELSSGVGSPQRRHSESLSVNTAMLRSELKSDDEIPNPTDTPAPKDPYYQTENNHHLTDR